MVARKHSRSFRNSRMFSSVHDSLYTVSDVYLCLLLITIYTNTPTVSGHLINITLINNEVARDPTSRMPFTSAGLEIRTIGCSYVHCGMRD